MCQIKWLKPIYQSYVGVCGIRWKFRISVKPNRTKPSSKFKNRKLGFRGSVFKKPTSAVWGRFLRCLIHNSSCSMIESTVNIFFFMPYLCTSSSESLRLTVSWTSSLWKYVISSVIHIKQHTVQKNEPKTETAVNLTKPKLNRKLQFFLQNWTENRIEVMFCYPHTPSRIVRMLSVFALI